MTLDPDEPFERWLEKFDSIMSKPALYDELSRNASAHGLEAVKAAKRAYDDFERALTEAVAKVRS